MEETTDLLKIKIEEAKRELSLETVNAIDAVDWKTAILGLRSKFGYTFEQLGDLELETELLLCGLIGGEDYPKELENRLKINKTATNELVNEMNNLVFQKIQEELIKNIERKKVFQVSVKPEGDGRPLPNLPLSKGEERRGSDNSPHPDPLLVKERGNRDTEILNSAGIEIVSNLPMQTSRLELTEIPAHTSAKEPLENREEMLQKIEKPEATPSILAQKLSGPSQIPMVQTEHFLENLTKNTNDAPTSIPQTPKAYVKGADPYRLSPDE